MRVVSPNKRAGPFGWARFVAVLAVLVGCCFSSSTIPSVRASESSNSRNSKVLVHIPFNIHNASGFPHALAEFGAGTAPWTGGKSLAEYVYFVEASLCRPIRDITEGHPKRSDNHTWMTPPFLLLAEDGDCSAVTKARHAQMSGASALLIADQKCRCSDAACLQRFNDTDCIPEDAPVLVNDGSGSDISIPTFQLFRGLSHDLKENLQKDQPCLVELQWGIPVEDDDTTSDDKKNHLPHFHFWSTAYDPLVSLEFYVNLKIVATALSDHVVFAPRFALVDGARFGCSGTANTNDCDHLCTNQGRYCTKHATELSGHAIVRETLTRLCIWKHYGDNDDSDSDDTDTPSKIKKDPEKYWNYAIYHKQLCSADPHNFADEKCLADGMKEAGIDAATIQQCISAAGDLEADNSNALLDAELLHLKHSSVHTLPALTVNRNVLQWTTAHSLFDTLCTEFWLSPAIKEVPKVCTQCASCPNVIGCLEHKGKCVEFDNEQRHPETGYKRTDGDDKKKGHGWKVFWILTVLVATCGGAYYYYDQNRDRFGRRGGGGGRMNDYMHLPGGEFQ